MSNPNTERSAFVSQVGVEARQHIGTRMKELEPLRPTERIIVELAAVAVCLANTLRPAIEACNSRASAADQLLTRVMREARMLLEPVIGQQP